MNIDSTIAALLGATIGGVIGVIGTIITVVSTSRREFTSFRRSQLQQNFDWVSSAYEYALNVMFNIKRDGNPDRATYGNVFAQLSLFGSPEVKSLFDHYLALDSEKKKEFETQKLINAMKEHLHSLQNATK